MRFGQAFSHLFLRKVLNWNSSWQREDYWH